MSQSTPETIPMPALRLPTVADVARLAAERHPMCLSVLMSTTPAEVMLPGDRATLQGLTLDALRRLDEEPDRPGAAQTRAGLAATIARALTGPTDRGLAILVSPEGAHLLHLRVAPRDRVVLYPTFATRDLVRSAAEDPAFLTVVIDGRAARLLHYGQRYTRPILGHDFPMIRPTDTPRGSASGSSERAPEEHGVLDDAVDELIEAALARGAEVVTVPDGALARHGHLVLALRGPAPARAG